MFRPRAIRNVLLDWSGTIVDDLPPVVEATNRVLDFFHKSPLTREQFCREFSLPFEDFYERVLPGVPMSKLDSLYTKFFDCSKEKVTELPGARIFLDYCASSQHRIFLLSSIKTHHFELQSKELGLRGYFEFPYTEVLNKKKHIHSIMKEQGLDPRETLFAGDMKHDIETAKFANLLAVGTLTGYNSREQLNEAGPDLLVDNLSALVDCI